GLIDILREDVVLIADGGGKSFSFGGQRLTAAPNPIEGRRNVSKFLLTVQEKVEKHVPDLINRIISVNGLPSILSCSGDIPICLICLEIADDRITNVYVQTNPDKIKNLQGI